MLHKGVNLEVVSPGRGEPSEPFSLQPVFLQESGIISQGFALRCCSLAVCGVDSRHYSQGYSGIGYCPCHGAGSILGK